MNFPFSVIKEQLQPLILSNLLRFCRTGIVARKYHKYYLWYFFSFRHAYIEKSPLYDNIISCHPFFLWYCRFFTRELEAIHMSRRLFISQHLLQPTIITSGLIREKSKSMFISGKPLRPCFFKGTYLFHRTNCNNFCLKSTVSNA